MHSLNTIIKSNNDLIREKNIANALVANRFLTYDLANSLVKQFDAALASGDEEAAHEIENENPELGPELTRIRELYTRASK